MDINQRIRKIRQIEKKTQAEFADAIGVKRVTVTWMEKSGNNIVDQNKQIICDKFHINPHWLETGEGEMYAPPAERDLIDEMRERYRLNPIEEQILRVYMEMTLPERERLVRYAKEVNGFLDKAFEAARTIAATIAASPQAPASAEPPASAGEATAEEISAVAGDELDADPAAAFARLRPDVQQELMRLAPAVKREKTREALTGTSLLSACAVAGEA